MNDFYVLHKAGGTVQFEITVRYEILWAKSTVWNYGTIYFPKYGTVRKYNIFFVLFSNLFRTNLIIERRPLRHVRNEDLYHFCRVSMKYSKLYRVLHIVQKKKCGPHPFPRPVFQVYRSVHREAGFLKAENNFNIISVLVDFFLEGAQAFRGG